MPRRWSSTTRCAWSPSILFAQGSTGILIGGTEVTAPYVIEVIGDPPTLASALSFPSGPTSQFEGDDATVEVEQLDDVRIESVRPASD